MNKKLFISNLDFEINTNELQELFTSIGPCVSAVIATDRETKRSKGFAFIEMESEEIAEKAIQELNNKILRGRPIKVCEDRGKGGGSSFSSESSEGGRGGGRKYEILPPIQRTQLFKKKKRLDPFLEDPTKTVDFRDIGMLNRFLSERGKILSRRLTGLSAYNQRKVSKAIKRAQQLGLLPFSSV